MMRDDWKKNLSQRQRFVLGLSRLTNRWDDLVSTRNWPDWAYAPEHGFIGWWCWVLNSHIVVNDQCGYKEHRYCVACSQPTPGYPVFQFSEKS